MAHSDYIAPNTVTVGTGQTALPAFDGDEVIIQSALGNPDGSIIRIGTDGMTNVNGGMGILFELGPGDSIALSLHAYEGLLFARASTTGLYLYVAVLGG